MKLLSGRLLDLVGTFGRPNRREFLRLSALGAAAISCHPRPAPKKRVVAPTPTTIAPPPRKGTALSLEEWRTIEAATARILPSDDGAGAREANVVRFIDAQLITAMLAPLAPLFIKGARLFDESAQARFRRRFDALDDSSQDEILGALSRGELDAKGFPQVPFFHFLHSLTIEGFLSDPVHGGNANQVGWRFIGFAEPHLRVPSPGGHKHHLPVVP